MKADVTRKRLEQTVRQLGQSLGEALPREVGFALLLFNMPQPGEPDPAENWMSYISNAQRDTMLLAMEEFCARWRSQGRPPDDPR